MSYYERGTLLCRALRNINCELRLKVINHLESQIYSSRIVHHIPSPKHKCMFSFRQFRYAECHSSTGKITCILTEIAVEYPGPLRIIINHKQDIMSKTITRCIKS